MSNIATNANSKAIVNKLKKMYIKKTTTSCDECCVLLNYCNRILSLQVRYDGALAY